MYFFFLLEQWVNPWLKQLLKQLLFKALTPGLAVEYPNAMLLTDVSFAFEADSVHFSSLCARAQNTQA